MYSIQETCVTCSGYIYNLYYNVFAIQKSAGNANEKKWITYTVYIHLYFYASNQEPLLKDRTIIIVLSASAALSTSAAPENEIET